MRPEWFRVVLHYRETVRYAPTIPFVLGALRDPFGAVVEDEERCIDELRRLMQLIVEDTPGKCVIQIHRCRQIEQPVLVPQQIGLYDIPGNPFESTAQVRVTVFVDDEFVEPGSNDLDPMVETLWEELGEALLGNRFSYDRKRMAYREYDDHDRQIIRDALGRT